MKKLFILFIVVAGFGVSSYAQNNQNVNATGTIVAGISLARVTDINFGLIIPGAAGSTVTLGTLVGDKALPGTGTPTILGVTSHNAELTVSCSDFSTYSISFSPATLSLTGLGSPMSLAVAVSGTLAANPGTTKKIYVGGTLTIPDAGGTQVAGVYTSVAPVNVVVAYE